MGGKGKKEILRMTFLRSVNSHWVVRHRSDKGANGRLCEEDNILRIQRAGKGLGDKLKLCGINKVKYL